MNRNTLPSRSHSTRLRTKEEEGDPTNEQEERPSTESGVSQNQLTVMLQWMQQQEERRREEDRAREEWLQRENLAREERMQQTLITMLNAQAEREATRAQAEEERRRQDEEQRHLEQCLHRQEEKEKEEEKRKEAETSKTEERRLEAIQRDAPKMAQMREDTDVEDFLGELILSFSVKLLRNRVANSQDSPDFKGPLLAGLLFSLLYFTISLLLC